MSWSGLAKFFIGVTLAIAILFFAGASVARYLLTQLASPPPKPTFPNDSPSPTAIAAQPSTSPQAAASPTEAAAANPEADPEASPETPSEEPSPSPSLEAGTYRARVTQPIGLILRQEPSRDSNQLGGVEYEEEVTVLETSSDGEWLRVQLGDSGIEGWIKAGNTEQVN
jgi:hypothetical protein